MPTQQRWLVWPADEVTADKSLSLGQQQPELTCSHLGLFPPTQKAAASSPAREDFTLPPQLLAPPGRPRTPQSSPSRLQAAFQSGFKSAFFAASADVRPFFFRLAPSGQGGTTVPRTLLVGDGSCSPRTTGGDQAEEGCRWASRWAAAPPSCRFHPRKFHIPGVDGSCNPRALDDPGLEELIPLLFLGFSVETPPTSVASQQTRGERSFAPGVSSAQGQQRQDGSRHSGAEALPGFYVRRSGKQPVSHWKENRKRNCTLKAEQIEIDSFA
ncbi:uncharacterized protein PHA67_022086 [Liasis olivaceus]